MTPADSSDSRTERTPHPAPSGAQLKRWRRNLAEERAEASVYRDLASRRDGEERAILLGLAEAEKRHEAHWLELLGEQVGRPVRPSLNTRVLGFLARRFGSVFALALVQSAESRSRNVADVDATDRMAADERVHGEVVRALAERGRNRMSGTFRAAVFGADDGLVSNLALVLGIGATGVSGSVVLFTGITGLIAGALSMGAGEYVSVRSQRELLEASRPDPAAVASVPDLDVDANELALVYRARGLDEAEAALRAAELLARVEPVMAAGPAGLDGSLEQVGTGWRAAASSFLFFSTGALVPVLPWLFGMGGLPAVILASVLVGIALLFTGGVVGVLSGAPPLPRALRQLAIGYGAAAVTYAIGAVAGVRLA